MSMSFEDILEYTTLALLVQDVVVRQKVEPGTRVTVKMGDSRPKPGEDFSSVFLLYIWFLT